MNYRGLFRTSGNVLEGGVQTSEHRTVACPKCGREVSVDKIRRNYFVCPRCGYYYSIRARRRILMLTDKRSFYEHDRELESTDILSFPGYKDKLEKAKEKSREKEAVITGVAKIDGISTAVFSMDSRFMMGAMGVVCGEKITRLFEYATANSLPVLGITVSGGARMQEGMLSLMQMSKVSAAVKRHSSAGNLYVTLLTNPTTGGVDASFAMLGDITLAEPGARVGFAGPRVIEKTLKTKLPEKFQLAEEVLECGFIDIVVPRREQRECIARILRMHTKV